MSRKPTKAQLAFLKQHVPSDWQHKARGYEDGFRPKSMVDRGTPTYDFVGRCADAGLVEIVGGTSRLRWPFDWGGTHLTPAGRAAITPKEAKNESA